MKTRQSTRRASKRSVRPATAKSPPAAPEEPATFGRRRPREIELGRGQSRPDACPDDNRGGSLLRALVNRIFR